MSHVVWLVTSVLNDLYFLLVMPRGSRRRAFQVLRCPFAGCPKTFRSESGRTNHVRSVHPRANLNRHHVLPLADIQVPPSPTRLSPSLSNVNLSQEGSPEPPSIHQAPSPEPGSSQAAPEQKTYHPFLNGKFSFWVLLYLFTNSILF